MEINSFNFSRIPEIIFGKDKFYESFKSIKKFGKNVLIVTGSASLKNSGRLDSFISLLKKNSMNYFFTSIKNEPTPEIIDSNVKKFKSENIEAVVAIGGGSVLDSGKAISAMLTQNDSVLNYLEDVGTKIHNGKKIPFIAIPTTAGTGSEATKNAVLSNTGNSGFKRSLRHNNFIPDIAIIDSELIRSCPQSIAAACGMDAFTQLLEGYVSTNSNPMTDALAISGMTAVKDNIIDFCCGSSDNHGCADGLAYAALLSGIVLANAGLGIVHGFASSIGSFFNVPHGVICGTLLGSSVKMNIAILKKDKSKNRYLKKFIDIGKLLCSETDETDDYYLEQLITTISEWTDLLNLPLLSKYGITQLDVEKIVNATSNKNNPVILSKEELINLLTERI